jgi:lipid II:glycine glycyltransferase (peptidoglycan interpeptide bridge formation enzyme)
MNTKLSFSSHPLQSVEWAAFREKTGIKVIKGTNFQLTIHKVPHAPWTIGYLPKGPMPDEKMIKELKKIGIEEKCIFIQLEPNVINNENLKLKIENLGLRPAAHPLFTKYTFILDLTKSEEELLKNMHPKTRYNIKVAQKHGVKVIEDNSDKAFETYLKLMQETTKRQKFYAHTENYHRTMWETLGVKNQESNKLTAHLLLANYGPKTNDQRPKALAAWILFVYKDSLYYPYGASSDEYRETMASNLMMWEAIKFGKKLGLKKFDMWGALEQNPDKNDPWYGFHRFKQGYGGELTELAGSFDLVINPILYNIYKIIDKLRWFFLKILK